MSAQPTSQPADQPAEATATAAPIAGDDFRGAYVNLDALLALRAGPFHREPQRRERSTSGGQRLSRLRGRGMDFAEVRAYQPGDDIRTIDWHVTARKNKPHTKVFREERERPTLIYVDQTYTQFFGSRRRLKSVAAAELAARLAWRCLDAGDRVGGLISGVDGVSIARPLQSPRAVARLLGQLTEHNHALSRTCRRDAGARLASDLHKLRQLARSQHRIYFISDFLPPAAFWLNTLEALAAHNDVAVAHLVDPLEAQMPINDSFMVTDTEQRVAFDARDRGLAERYQAAFAERSDQLRQRLRQLGVVYRRVSTDQPLDLPRLGF